MTKFEQLPYADEGLLTGEFYFHRLCKLIPALEPAHLVELGCVGKVCFGDYSEVTASLKQDGAVEEPAFETHRGANCQQGRKLFSGVEYLSDSVLCSRKEPFLGEKVGTAVACDAQFREDENGGAVVRRFSCHADDFFCILDGIGQPYPWRGCRYPEETVGFACHIMQI